MSMKEKIETILIREVEKLYDKAATPIGLDLEDIRKLELISKIKISENIKEPTRKVNPGNLPIGKMKEMAASHNDNQKNR